MTDPTIIIDFRCLQDQRFIERGIQSHSRSAIRHARETLPKNTRIVGVTDLNLDPVPDDVRGVADEIVPNAYLPGVNGIFVNPSPMEPNQSFVGRLLLNQSVRKAAFVYDFIPFEEPARYLAAAPARLDYFTAMTWLDRYDLFLPISEYTKQRLAALFRLGDRPAVVTGVPLAPWLETEAPSPPLHVLVVAGDDPRKNPELAVRAHAAAKALQARRVGLVITGHYPPARQAEFRALAAAHGGDPALLEMPGRVAQEVLLAQYRHALCVVTPSRAEGFSMPVIEAMAARVPSIASDIPVHVALVADPTLRFGVDDAGALTALLDRFATDDGFRAGVVAAQSGIWPEFRAKDVAAKVWRAVMTLAPVPAPAITGAKPRIALLTPLPPSKSGIADFSALLANSFDGRADISLFANVATGEARPVSGLPHLSNRFDRVVGVMGNSSEHFRIHELLLTYGGACVCHDSRLLGFSVVKFGRRAAARIAAQELGRAVSEDEVEAWLNDEDLREADFLGPLAAAARPLMFHTRHSVAAVQRRFGVTAHYLPFALYRPWPDRAIADEGRTAARARLGLLPSERVIVSFGFIHGTKGVAAALRALAVLTERGVYCHLYWVGQAHQDIGAFKTLATELGIAARVHFLDRFVAEAEYRDWLQAADYGLQLRLGGRGNISGALADCIAAGLPTVASADLAENVEAPSFVRRVPDPLAPGEIAAAIVALIESDGERLGWREERLDYCERHSMQAYAAGLCALLGL